MTMISEKGNQDERRAKADLNITMTAPSGDSVLPDEKVQLSETPDTLESSLKLSNVLGGINNELAKSSALEDELDKQNAIDKIKIDGAVEEIAIKLENMKNNMAVDLVKNDTHENFVMAYAQKEHELKIKGSLNRTEELRKFVDDYKNTWTTDAIDLTEYGRNYINDAIDSSAVGMEASSYASELKDMLDAHKKKFQSDASQLAIKVGRGDVTFDNAFLTATATMADLNKKGSITKDDMNPELRLAYNAMGISYIQGILNSNKPEAPSVARRELDRISIYDDVISMDERTVGILKNQIASAEASGSGITAEQLYKYNKEKISSDLSLETLIKNTNVLNSLGKSNLSGKELVQFQFQVHEDSTKAAAEIMGKKYYLGDRTLFNENLSGLKQARENGTSYVLRGKSGNAVATLEADSNELAWYYTAFNDINDTYKNKSVEEIADETMNNNAIFSTIGNNIISAIGNGIQSSADQNSLTSNLKNLSEAYHSLGKPVVFPVSITKAFTDKVEHYNKAGDKAGLTNFVSKYSASLSSAGLSKEFLYNVGTSGDSRLKVLSTMVVLPNKPYIVEAATYAIDNIKARNYIDYNDKVWNNALTANKAARDILASMDPSVRSILKEAGLNVAFKSLPPGANTLKDKAISDSFNLVLKDFASGYGSINGIIIDKTKLDPAKYGEIGYVITGNMNNMKSFTANNTGMRNYSKAVGMVWQQNADISTITTNTGYAFLGKRVNGLANKVLETAYGDPIEVKFSDIKNKPASMDSATWGNFLVSVASKKMELSAQLLNYQNKPSLSEADKTNMAIVADKLSIISHPEFISASANAVSAAGIVKGTPGLGNAVAELRRPMNGTNISKGIDGLLSGLNYLSPAGRGATAEVMNYANVYVHDLSKKLGTNYIVTSTYRNDRSGHSSGEKLDVSMSEHSLADRLAFYEHELKNPSIKTIGTSDPKILKAFKGNPKLRDLTEWDRIHNQNHVSHADIRLHIKGRK